jgi:hypothetical protein
VSREFSQKKNQLQNILTFFTFYITSTIFHYYFSSLFFFFIEIFFNLYQINHILISKKKKKKKKKPQIWREGVAKQGELSLGHFSNGMKTWGIRVFSATAFQ